MRRLAHISDLHFGKADEGLVFALRNDLRGFAPDVLAVTGDLTQRAKRYQFAAASEFLRDFSCPKIIVPGNHDIFPIYQPLRRLLSPYARYQCFISRNLDTSFCDDKLLVFGLNSVHPFRIKEGGLSPHQLRWLLAETRAHPGRFRIVATHHPLVKPPGRLLRERVRGQRRALDALESADIQLLLSGHLHETFSGPAAARIGAAESVLVVQASTTTSTRLRGHDNAYNRIYVDGRRVAIEVRVWKQERFISEDTRRYERVGSVWRRL